MRSTHTIQELIDQLENKTNLLAGLKNHILNEEETVLFYSLSQAKELEPSSYDKYLELQAKLLQWENALARKIYAEYQKHYYELSEDEKALVHLYFKRYVDAAGLNDKDVEAIRTELSTIILNIYDLPGFVAYQNQTQDALYVTSFMNQELDRQKITIDDEVDMHLEDDSIESTITSVHTEELPIHEQLQYSPVSLARSSSASDGDQVLSSPSASASELTAGGGGTPISETAKTSAFSSTPGSARAAAAASSASAVGGAGGGAPSAPTMSEKLAKAVDALAAEEAAKANLAQKEALKKAKGEALKTVEAERYAAMAAAKKSMEAYSKETGELSSLAESSAKEFAKAQFEYSSASKEVKKAQDELSKAELQTESAIADYITFIEERMTSLQSEDKKLKRKIGDLPKLARAFELAIKSLGIEPSREYNEKFTENYGKVDIYNDSFEAILSSIEKLCDEHKSLHYKDPSKDNQQFEEKLSALEERIKNLLPKFEADYKALQELTAPFLKADKKLKATKSIAGATALGISGTVAGLGVADIYLGTGPVTELGELVKAAGVDGLGSSVNTGLATLGVSTALALVIGLAICQGIKASLAKGVCKEAEKPSKARESSAAEPAAGRE